MSIGQTGGIISSAAGSPLQQRSGPEAERRAKETSDRNRQVDSSIKSEAASGIGKTDEDSETSDRDADGRRLWELQQQAHGKETEDVEHQDRLSKDPKGTAGGELDLTG